MVRLGILNWTGERRACSFACLIFANDPDVGICSRFTCYFWSEICLAMCTEVRCSVLYGLRRWSHKAILGNFVFCRD